MTDPVIESASERIRRVLAAACAGDALGAATVGHGGIRDTALTGAVLAALGFGVAVYSVARDPAPLDRAAPPEA